MSVRLISRNEKYPENPKEKDTKPKNKIELTYVTEYDVEVATPKTSLAKTYEIKNEMTITLEVPKSEYKKNKDFQELLKWAEFPVQHDDYYRDIAVNLKVAGDNERTVLFTHGRITIDIHNTTKSDFVTVKMFVKQKEDQYIGIVFGEKLEETYKEARRKVENPPTLNIWFPPAKDRFGKNAQLLVNREYAQTAKEKVKLKGLNMSPIYDGAWVHCNFPESFSNFSHNKIFNCVSLGPSDKTVRMFYSYANGGYHHEPTQGYYRIAMIKETTDAEVEIIKSTHQAGTSGTADNALKKFYDIPGGVVNNKGLLLDTKNGLVAFSLVNKDSQKYNVIYETDFTNEVGYTGTVAFTGFIDFKVTKGKVKILDYIVENKNGETKKDDKIKYAEPPKKFYQGDNSHVTLKDMNHDGPIFEKGAKKKGSNGKILTQLDINETDYKVYAGKGDYYKLDAKIRIESSEFKQINGNEITNYKIGYETGNSRHTNLNGGTREIISITLADKEANYPDKTVDKKTESQIKIATWSEKNNGYNYYDNRYLMKYPENYYNLGNWTTEYYIEVALDNKNTKIMTFTLNMSPSGSGTVVMVQLLSEHDYDKDMKEVPIKSKAKLFEVKSLEQNQGAEWISIRSETVVENGEKFIKTYYDGAPERKNSEDNSDAIMEEGMKSFKLNEICSFDVDPKTTKIIKYKYVLSTGPLSHVYHIWTMKQK